MFGVLGQELGEGFLHNAGLEWPGGVSGAAVDAFVSGHYGVGHLEGEGHWSGIGGCQGER